MDRRGWQIWAVRGHREFFLTLSINFDGDWAREGGSDCARRSRPGDPWGRGTSAGPAGRHATEYGAERRAERAAAELSTAKRGITF